MSTTTIEWCIRPGTKPETWNPTTGCNKVSQGCKNCYAEVMHKRLQKMMPSKYSQPFLDGAVAHEDTLNIPFKWKSPRTVFVNSMSDLFHKDIPFEFTSNVFQVMRDTPQHTYIILTKRPENMMYFFSGRFYNDVAKEPLPNVWVGVSVEDQATANERIPYLLSTPAAVRFLSCEPLLGKILLKADWVVGKYPINWVIVGGESGNNARPMHPNWVRSLQVQCKVTPMPFFFKQWGEWLPIEFKDFTVKRTNCPIGYFNNSQQWIKGANVNESMLPNIINMVKVGKKFAGNTIDGKQYQEFPKTTTNA